MPKKNGELTRDERHQKNVDAFRLKQSEGRELAAELRQKRRDALADPLPLETKWRGKYDVKLAEIICNRIAGGEPLTSICREETMPAYVTVQKWQREREDFSDMMKKARVASAHAHIDLTREIAAAALRGDLESDVARVATQNLQWLAGKYNDKEFGDKKGIGADPNIPPVLNISLNKA